MIYKIMTKLLASSFAKINCCKIYTKIAH